MLKVAITGSSGLIGSRLIQLLNNQFEFLPLSTNDGFDISSAQLIHQRIKSLNFDIMLHLAAYTNVEDAEKNQQLAYTINALGTKHLFESVSKKKKPFIYISTDFVFNGIDYPFYESSTPNPVLYYGKSKYEGEKFLNQQAMIIRLSYPYGNSPAQKKDFVKNIIQALKNGNELKMIKNSLITPTYLDDIVFAISYLIQNYTNEIFHIVGADSLSPYEIGKIIAKEFGLNLKLIKPISYNDYLKNKAKRPQFSVIKSEKNTFYKMKSFAEGIKQIDPCF